MDLEDVRLAVYSGFAETGRAPTVRELADRFDASDGEVRVTLRELAAQHHLVVDGAAEVVMAHPFSSVPLGFAVMGSRTLWWGGCAWDSFALPHLLGASVQHAMLDDDAVLVSTRCPACGRAHAWPVGRRKPPDGDQVAHFLVPAARMWDDVVRTCANQRIFCSPVCVDRWLADHDETRGDVLDLPTLWQFAAHWYDGRLDRGYQRRDPADAAEYLRAVGLSGAFWGLG